MSDTPPSSNSPRFDFGSDIPLTKYHLQQLRRIHQLFCETSNRLAEEDQMRFELSGLTMMTRKHIERIEDPPFFWRLVSNSKKKPGVDAALSIDKGHAFAILERMLGFTGDPVAVERSLRTLERILLNQWIAANFLPIYEAVWKPLLALRITAQSVSRAVQSLPNSTQKETVVRIEFTTVYQKTPGTLCLYLPTTFVFANLSQTDTVAEETMPKPSDETRHHFGKGLLSTPVTLSVLLGTGTMKLADLRKLQVGDMLPLTRGPKDLLPVFVNGKRKFSATIRRTKEQLIVRIALPGDASKEE